MESAQIYHVTTKSIAGYVIFNNEQEYLRMQQVLQYYQNKNPRIRFSYFMNNLESGFEDKSQNNKNLVRIIAYCIMPTHIHLVLEELEEAGASIYMNKVLNSYTRYFNSKHNRKGPLWTGRFKRIVIESDEQLNHLTRYIHLNPVTAYLVNSPELWKFSSYNEYLENKGEFKLCEFRHIFEIQPSEYKNFVNNQISYQRELAKIKQLLLEE